MEKASPRIFLKRWRFGVIAGLFSLPVAAIFVAGILAWWSDPRLWWLWWFGPLCWVVAYLLIRLWRDKLTPSLTPDTETPDYWTPRDEAAWKLVQQCQDRVVKTPPDQLAEPQYYLDSAVELGRTVARHYHPQSRDPIGSLTVPEILAAALLAIEDTAKTFDKYVPGGHLATIDQWRVLIKSPQWLGVVGDTWWILSLVWNPWNVARYIASRMAMQAASRQFRDNAWAWFYMVFIRHVGFYLIEMNSGRLRGGADRYRAFRNKFESPVDHSTEKPQLPATTSPVTDDITITLIGKVNAGKSSLINALTGQQQAQVDVLPQTRSVARYQLPMPGTNSSQQLVLLDTPGYGEEGTSPAQQRELESALEQADLVLLVMDAANPARQADLLVTQSLLDRYRAPSPLKPPPFIGVLTHIDNLRPGLEWEPPYDWLQPKSVKEKNIAEAVAYNRQEFGPLMATIIPVCSDVARRKSYGIDEQLLPTIVSLLDEARACALLRTLHRDLDNGQARRVWQQISNTGLKLLQAYVLGVAAISRATSHPPR